MKYLSLLFLCFLSFSGNAIRKSPVAPLTGTYTLAKQLMNDKLQTVSGSKSKISIDQSRETIKCYLGCNSISGEFSAVSGELEPLQLSTTEKWCSNKLQALERQFMKNMSRVNYYKTSKTMLYLMDADEVIIVLKRK